MPEVLITAFYSFKSLTDQQQGEIIARLTREMELNEIRGMVLVAPEGINGTIAGAEDPVLAIERDLRRDFPEIRFKHSRAPEIPFRRIRVVARRELITSASSGRVPSESNVGHLSPEEWHQWMASDREYVMIDTRNDFEVRVGRFRGAINPGLEKFSEWEEYLERADHDKQVPVLLYCTGGIRCEKAILAMMDQGFSEVYQLRDGVLGYLELYPQGFFEGECFVFDERVAVDCRLQPTSSFLRCARCGQPSARPEITCGECLAAMR